MSPSSTDLGRSQVGDLKAGRSDVKVPLMWIPLWALYGVARVFAYGARRYAPGNWTKAAKDGSAACQDYVSAALRHYGAIQEADPEKVASWIAPDEESGLPHLDHLICSLVMLRGIATLAGLLPRDPGKGNEPKKP